MAKLAKGTFTRLAVSIVLAIVAVALFILNKDVDVKTPEELQQEFVLSAQAIDREIDAVLEHFGIDKAWVQRKEITDDNKQFTRVERRVAIPPNLVPVIMNRELNLLARRYNGRAVATENLKENTVTIHILLQQSVIQTVILKVDQNIQTKGTREQGKKV